MTIEEVKHGDLQFAVKDINEVFGLKQNKIAGRQVLIDFIVGTIGACIGPDPENPGETIWTDPRAGQLKNETMATYDALTTQVPQAAAEPEPELAPEVKEEPLPETQATEEAGDAPKECPDFGKAYDPNDPACAEQCLRCAECQEAMTQAAKPITGRKRKTPEEKEAEKQAKAAEREAKKQERAAAKAAGASVPRKPKTPGELSNKQKVFKSWDESGRTKTHDILTKEIDGAVKETTVKAWLGSWKLGKNLPATTA